MLNILYIKSVIAAETAVVAGHCTDDVTLILHMRMTCDGTIHFIFSMLKNLNIFFILIRVHLVSQLFILEFHLQSLLQQDFPTHLLPCHGHWLQLDALWDPQLTPMTTNKY